MIITAHQPAYLPWLGYFEKIRNSDIYVYMDSVQFEVRSYINRNKIKTPNGSMWLAVPVNSKGHRDSTMLETRIDNNQNWKENHLKSIYLNYKKAPYFNGNFPKLEKLYEFDSDLLIDLCYKHLLFWLRELNITTRVIRLKDMHIQSKKSDLILDICKQLGANEYISGALGRGYIVEEDFNQHGIKVVYQDYKHPVYPQLWGEFTPYMSIVDLWMNTERFDFI